MCFLHLARTKALNSFHLFGIWRWSCLQIYTQFLITGLKHQMTICPQMCSFPVLPSYMTDSNTTVFNIKQSDDNNNKKQQQQQ